MAQDDVKYEMATCTTTTEKQTYESNSQGRNEEDNKEYNLAHELRHVIRLLRVFGMYCTPEAWINTDLQGARFRQHAQHLYCWIVQLALWFNGVRFLVACWYVESRLQSLNIMLCAWNFQSAVYCSTWYYVNCSEKLHKIFDLWQRICQDSGEGRLYCITDKMMSCLRRSVYILSGLCIFVIVANVTVIGFSVFGPIEAFRNDSILHEPFPPGTGIHITSLIIFSFANAAYVLPSSILLLLCLTYSLQFQNITKMFTAHISAEGKFERCLTRLRCQHQYLAKLVLLTDDAFSFYLAVTVVCTFFSACFGIYQLVVSGDLTLNARIMIGF